VTNWNRFEHAQCNLCENACSNSTHSQKIKQSPTKVVQKQLVESPLCFNAYLRKAYNKCDFADVIFQLNDGRKLFAHRVILASRCPYFNKMFCYELNATRPGVCNIDVHDHDSNTFSRTIEYIYKNRVDELDIMAEDELIDLITLSSLFCLLTLKQICGLPLARLVTVDNVSKLMNISSIYDVQPLRDACINFIRVYNPILKSDENFRCNIENRPELGLLIIEAMAEKRRRYDH
jgi:hypothetical protein